MISTKDAKIMILNIAILYLCTPLTRKEYLKMKLFDLPDSVVEHYQLRQKATADGHVYVAIKRECTASHKRGF